MIGVFESTLTLVCILLLGVCPVDIQIPSARVVMAPVQESGLASYYGSGLASEKGMHGSITANGERFEPLEQTCASRTIPFNTIVIVKMEETGDWTHCRVNDRGPYGAILHDNTWAAMFEGRDGYSIRRRNDDGTWQDREMMESKPGEYRGIMDLSFGTAKALGFDFDKGLNRITVKYFDKQKPNHLPIKIEVDYE